MLKDGAGRWGAVVLLLSLGRMQALKKALQNLNEERARPEWEGGGGVNVPCGDPCLCHHSQLRKTAACNMPGRVFMHLGATAYTSPPFIQMLVRKDRISPSSIVANLRSALAVVSLPSLLVVCSPVLRFPFRQAGWITCYAQLL